MNLPNRVPKVDSRQHSPLDGLSTSSNESSASLDSEDEDDFFQLEKDGFPLKPSSREKEAPANSSVATSSPISEEGIPPPPVLQSPTSALLMVKDGTPTKQKITLLSSPSARSLKKEELYPTSESETEHNSHSKQPPALLKSPPPTTSLPPTPTECVLPVARMPDPSNPSDDEVQFVKKRTRHLKKCTSYRPPDLLPSNNDVHAKESFHEQTIFANDPVRAPPLTISKEEINHLRSNHMLTTNFLDYLTQNAVPKDIPDHVLIASSNSYRFFEIQNEKDVDSPDEVDARTARLLRRKYQSYNMKPYRFMAINCSRSHFLVISATFDLSLGDLFEEVTVYDSLRRSSRGKDAVTANSIPGMFLREFQLFLANFCFFNTMRAKEFYDNPNKILENALYVSCPQQQNGVDCGLFGLATLLHVLHGVPPTSTSFEQVHISHLRRNLYHVLSNQTDAHVDPAFFCSFFPLLRFVS